MKLGFIGTGNMAGAIMGGIIKKGIIPAEEIIGSDIMETGRNHVKELYGIQVTADNKEVAEKADILVLSVKPQFYAETIQEIRESVREDQMVITIAPGKTLAWLEEQFGKPVRIVRTMPNTPALVGEGRVLVNGKTAKASVKVKPGDVIEIQFGTRAVKVEVLDLQETTKKEEAKELFRYI